MHPVNFLAPLTCILAISFGLQMTAPSKEGGKGTKDGVDNQLPSRHLYEMKWDIQSQISDQVGRELYASNMYLAMASYFGQDSVSLLGFKKFFMENSKEEKEHADKFVDYLNSRNGQLTSIKVTDATYKGSTGLQALQDALALEKEVTRNLMNLHQAASNKATFDVHLADYLESEILREQVESMRKLEGYISQLTRMAGENNNYLAEYLFDKQLKGEEAS